MAQPIQWESKDGKLYANGHRFHLKGVSRHKSFDL